MTLKEIYHNKKNNPVISFEIFPPKNDEDGAKLEKLLMHLGILKKYNPAFVSLTYGAGGTTQDTSLDIIKRVQDLELTLMPHFTCVGSSKAQVGNYLHEIKSLGIESILALRGDIPEGMSPEYFDFHYANELVSFIKSKTDFSIAVAGYPEGHIECSDLSLDLDNLKLKVDAGAEAIYTQMFFDNDKYFKFVELIHNKGIEIPVIPGILSIMNFNQLEKMLLMAKVTLPKKLMEKLEKYKDKPDDIKKIGIEFASTQCLQLISAGVLGLHFFTLNTSSSVKQILNNIE
jgi:methylenetetrahydrofolate reductase (NADPH)